MTNQDKSQALKQMLGNSPSFKNHYKDKLGTIIKVVPMFNSDLQEKLYAFLRLESKSK